MVVREAEEAIDAGDPGANWDELSTWLEHRVSAALADTFLWADRNATWLVEHVGQHFTEDAESAAPKLRLDDTEWPGGPRPGPRAPSSPGA